MAIHFRHLQVSENDVRANAVKHFQGFGAIGRRFNLESTGFQEAANGMPNQHGIVNDQG